MPDQPSTTSDHPPATRCPRCGESTAGRYCSGCGAPLRDVRCTHCGTVLAPGARFCNDCGAAAGAGGAAGPAEPNTEKRSEASLVRFVAIGAVVVLVSFVAGEVLGRRSGAPDVSAADPAPAATPAGMPAAPDISSMTPEERASRLFNRVMSYSEQGKLDSARFFAPMAIQSYAMMGTPDAHTRYDIGEIYAAVGDAVAARAEADTILATQPNHLLGLVLAARAADLAGDTAGASRFRRRLAAAAQTERARDVKEYTEHARDIDAALKK